MSGFASRTLFVGRERELRQLQTAFGQAAAGQGSLVMVAGEPGIGKTALCGRLAAYAVEHGGCALTGRCYEEGSLSLPYLPFVEALGGYVRTHESAKFAQELGAEAIELARILPELRAVLPAEALPAAPSNPQEGQYRLLQATTAMLERVSAAEPLLLLLEDLQDADRGTLTLLQHLAHRLNSARMLVVGTYRDVEVDRNHPLSAALANLRRVIAFDRLHLRGLDAREVQQILEGITGQPASAELAGAVRRQTEGNPLFAQEVSRYLLEEGHLFANSRQPSAISSPGSGTGVGSGAAAAMGIPEGLRDVIGRRLSRLSPDCNRVLAVAAVIGRDFGLETFQAVADLSGEQVVLALEEALRIGVLEEQSRPGLIRYRFAHSFFRQMLYEELIAPVRLRLHQRVARALEQQSSGQLGEHAAELAEHFAQSTGPAELSKAIRYGELAAERATAVYAYADAAAYLERALAIQRLLDPEDKARRCDLLLVLAEALLPAGELLRAVDSVAPEALALAEAMGDQHRASRACQVALGALVRHDHHLGVDTVQYRGWVEAADRYASPGSLDRVYADLAMVSPLYFADRQREAWDLLQRAMKTARALANGEALYQIAVRLFDLSWLPEHQTERRRVAEELFLQRREDVSEQTLGRFLIDSFIVFLDWGMRARAEEALREGRAITERTADPWAVVLSLMHDAVLAALDGKLEESVRAGERLRLRSAELGLPGPGELRGFIATLRPLLYLGRAEEALAGEPETQRIAVAEGRSLVFGAEVALCLAHLGRWREAQPVLDRLRARWNGETSTFDLSVGVLTSYLEAAVLAQDHDLAAKLSGCLAGLASLNTEIYATSIARHLGAAAALLGDRHAAYAYYQQALEVAGRVRFRPEITLTHLQIAELLLNQPADSGQQAAGDRGSVGARHAVPVPRDAQRTEALQCLDFAIPELQNMKMQPALDRALALLERAQTPPASAATKAPAYPDRLSEREVQVLRLLAAGRTNQAIADELVISLNTVTRHISNLFGKTGASNRTEAAAYAHQRGLA